MPCSEDLLLECGDAAGTGPTDENIDGDSRLKFDRQRSELKSLAALRRLDLPRDHQDQFAERDGHNSGEARAKREMLICPSNLQSPQPMPKSPGVCPGVP